MQLLMNFNMSGIYKLIPSIIILLLFAGSSYSQSIQGATSVTTGTSYDYSYDEGGTIVGPSWTATKGTVVTSWISGTTYWVTIKWTTTGSGSVKLTSSTDGKLGQLSVSIGACSIGAPVANAATFSRCTPGVFTLKVTVGSGATANWYDADGSVLATNTTSYTTSSLSVNKTFYFTSYNSATGCESSKYSYVASINSIPDPPYVVSVIDACGSGGIATFKGSPPTGTIAWYSNNTTGTASSESLATGQTFLHALTGTQTYYMSTFNPVTLCESPPSTRTPITGVVKPLPKMTATSGTETICSGDITTITISSDIPGTVYSWDTSGQNILGGSQGTMVAVPSIVNQLINLSRDSYALEYSIYPYFDGCSGSPAVVSINVNPRPLLTVTNNLPALCGGQQATSITLGNTNNVTGAVYSWTPSSSSDISGASPATNTTATSIAQPLTISGNTPDNITYTIYASATFNGLACSSPTQTTTVTVKPAPVAQATAVQTIFVGSNTNVTLSSSIPNTTYSYSIKHNNNVSNYTDSQGAINAVGQPLTVADNINPGNITFNIVPSFAGCTGATDTSRVYVYPTPKIIATQPTVYLGTQSTLSVQPFYDTYTWNSHKAGTQTGITSLTTKVPDIFSLSVTKNGVSSSTSYSIGGQMSGVNQNYITSNTMLIAESDTSKLELLPIDSLSQAIQYFDGLGRPMQTVMTQASPSRQDIVQPVVYDAFGREYRKYLPFTGGADGSYKSGVIDAAGHYSGTAVNFYSQGGNDIANDTAYYARTIFEASPLNRVLKQGAPGGVWQPDPSVTNMNDNSVKKNYLISLASDSVLFFTYDGASGLVTATADGIHARYYDAGQLTVNKTTDEHSNEVIEFIDKRGHTLLKKAQYATVNTTKLYTCTYYIYDDYDNLRIVLPPEAIKSVLSSFTTN